MWEGGAAGIAECHYPHPKGWRLEASTKVQGLERMTVRILTALYREPYCRPPTCERNWPQALGLRELPFTLLWARLCSPLLTPRDFKAQARIYHRRLFLRAYNKEAPSPQCRCCGAAPERFRHLAQCEQIRECWSYFIAFASPFIKGISASPALIYLGLVTNDHPLPGGLSALHILIWKFLLISFTRVDTDGEKFHPRNVWMQALRRFQSKLKAAGEAMRLRALRKVALERPPPSVKSMNSYLEPVAHFDDNCILHIDDRLERVLSGLNSELTEGGSLTHRRNLNPYANV